MNSKPLHDPKVGCRGLFPAAPPTFPAARCPDDGFACTYPNCANRSVCESLARDKMGTAKPERSEGAAGNAEPSHPDESE